MFPRAAIASITGIGGMAGGFGSMILQKVARDSAQRLCQQYYQREECENQHSTHTCCIRVQTGNSGNALAINKPGHSLSVNL